jgi:spermidine synthase
MWQARSLKYLFQVIITDSSDPIGPAESLFAPPFFALLGKSLKADGIMCSQGECMWLHPDIIQKSIKALRLVFPIVKYAFTTIPTYPSGQIGFFICAKSADAVLDVPKRNLSAEEESCFRYYNSDVHEAAFKLPSFAKRIVQ